MTNEVPIPTPENPFRSVTYIAEVMSVKQITVRDWLRSGALKGYKENEGRTEWKILHSDFAEFLQKRYGSE